MSLKKYLCKDVSSIVRNFENDCKLNYDDVMEELLDVSLILEVRWFRKYKSFDVDKIKLVAKIVIDENDFNYPNISQVVSFIIDEWDFKQSCGINISCNDYPLNYIVLNSRYYEDGVWVDC